LNDSGGNKSLLITCQENKPSRIRPVISISNRPENLHGVALAAPNPVRSGYSPVPVHTGCCSKIFFKLVTVSSANAILDLDQYARRDILFSL
jgi:hypothetical protein